MRFSILLRSIVVGFLFFLVVVFEGKDFIMAKVGLFDITIYTG